MKKKHFIDQLIDRWLADLRDKPSVGGVKLEPGDRIKFVKGKKKKKKKRGVYIVR